MKPKRSTRTSAEICAEMIYGKLRESSAYHVYQRAFMDATGLPLILESVRLGERDLASRPRRAGLQTLSAPVRIGNSPVALLVSGQFLAGDLSQSTASTSAKSSLKLDPVEAEARVTPRGLRRKEGLSRQQADLALALLDVLAELLGGLINPVLLEDRPGDPGPVSRSKIQERERSGEPVAIEEAARSGGLCAANFGGQFRKATGLSASEYVARCRLERARRHLLQCSRHELTEVAGFAECATWTDFDQLFFHFLGEKPVPYRDRMLENRSRLATLGLPSRPRRKHRLTASIPDFLTGHADQW